MFLRPSHLEQRHAFTIIERDEVQQQTLSMTLYHVGKSTKLPVEQAALGARRWLPARHRDLELALGRNARFDGSDEDNSLRIKKILF